MNHANELQAQALHGEAERCFVIGEDNKALQLLRGARILFNTPDILYTRSVIYALRRRFDLAYVDVAEALGMQDSQVLHNACVVYMRILGYRRGFPARRERLTIYTVEVDLGRATAILTTRDGEVLQPSISTFQLNPFLHDETMGNVRKLTFLSGGRSEDEVVQLLNGTMIDYAYHVDLLSFTNCFNLPWEGIERVFDGETLRAKEIHFKRLLLPIESNATDFLKLSTISECVDLKLSDMSQLLGPPPPLFDNAALIEWIKKSADRSLEIECGYLSAGLDHFLKALKEARLAIVVMLSDFQEDDAAHSYCVRIYCTGISMHEDFEMQDNQHNETMIIQTMMDEQKVMVKVDRTVMVLAGH